MLSTKDKIGIPVKFFSIVFPKFYNEIKNKIDLSTDYIDIKTEDAMLIELFLNKEKSINLGRRRYEKIFSIINKYKPYEWSEKIYNLSKLTRIKKNEKLKNAELVKQFIIYVEKGFKNNKIYYSAYDLAKNDYTENINQQTLAYAYKNNLKMLGSVYKKEDGNLIYYFRTSKKLTQ